jgi:hypothetical protein
MKIPKVTNNDILRAFLQEVPAAEQAAFQRNYTTHADRLRVHSEFRQMWINELGQLFETPDDDQLFKWLKISKWDLVLLKMAVEDLAKRAKHGMDAQDPHGHAVRHFTSALVRRLRGKYGPPPLKRAA